MSKRRPSFLKLPKVVHASLPEAAATVLETIMLCRVGKSLDVAKCARLLGCDQRGAFEALDDAEKALMDIFYLKLFPPHRPWFEAQAAATDFDQVPLNDDFIDLIESPPRMYIEDVGAPPMTADLGAWVNALAAASAQNISLHLGFRCQLETSRSLTDLASLLHGAGLPVVLLEAKGMAVAGELLRVEMHAGEQPTIVVVDGLSLIEKERHSHPPEADDKPPFPSVSPILARLLKGLKALRCSCIWPMAASAILPADLAPYIAGCLDPIIAKRSWHVAKVEALIGPDATSTAASLIAASIGDPRDAQARVQGARMLAAGGMPLESACAIIARSIAPPPAASSVPPEIDVGLYSHIEEIELLFARASAIFANAGRILFYGAPGGGKSTIARCLAQRMPGLRAPIIVEASDLLVGSYGGTERLVAQLWQRAEMSHAPLIIDEIDALCGLRDPGGSSSGNSYLVRTLTDEWIRQFDAHPDVCVLATCNDRAAIDPAICRRFVMGYEIVPTLPPEVEARAWLSILKMEPPADWTPCGAAICDFVAARVRCEILGTLEPTALAAAVRKARDQRCGRTTGSKRRAAHLH